MCMWFIYPSTFLKESHEWKYMLFVEDKLININHVSLDHIVASRLHSLQCIALCEFLTLLLVIIRAHVTKDTLTWCLDTSRERKPHVLSWITYFQMTSYHPQIWESHVTLNILYMRSKKCKHAMHSHIMAKAGYLHISHFKLFPTVG